MKFEKRERFIDFLTAVGDTPGKNTRERTYGWYKLL